MEKKLDFSGKLDFNDIDLTAPNVVVEEIASQISQATNNIVQGIVTKYTGPVASYTQKGLSGLTGLLGTEDRQIDIQTTLGKQGEEDNKYEFYLNTPSYERYKYRICYLQYGIGNYPVKVVLEQSVANSISTGSNANYVKWCRNRGDLEDLIINVLYSKRIIDIMQELIRINQIKKDLTPSANTNEQSAESDAHTQDETVE